MDELSLRDYFAGQALAGMIGGRKNVWKNDEANRYAEWSYAAADAMCRERKLGLERATLERLNVEITKYTQVPEEETRPGVQSVDQEQGQSMPDSPTTRRTIFDSSVWSFIQPRSRKHPMG